MLAGQRGLAEPEPGEPKLVLAVPQARDTCTGPAKRDVSAGWTTRAIRWGLPPVLLRLGVRTKDPGRLLPGGEMADMPTPRSLRCCPGHSGLMKPT